MSLNEKFIKARKDYELLLETSMAQPASHYGRPGQSPYNYGGDAYPTGGVEPSRYYTGPPHTTSSPPNIHPAFAPPAQQKPAGAPYPAGPARRTSNSFYPPQGDGHESAPHAGGAPFYVVGQVPPGAQIPGRQGPSNPSNQQGDFHSQRPHPGHLPSGPGGPTPDGGSQPQELATSAYDSPLEARPVGGGGFNPHPSKLQSQERPLSPSQPPGPGQPPYSGYHGYQQQPQPRPLSAGPGPNPNPNQPYPESNGPPSVYPSQKFGDASSAGYPSLTPQPSTPGGSGISSSTGPYQPYGGASGSRPSFYPPDGPPQGSAPPGPGPGQGSAPTQQDYYRNNELFLPPGSRAQS